MCAPHMNGDRIRAYFGLCQKVESTGMLRRMAREGVPAHVLPYAGMDAALGRTIAFPVMLAEEIGGCGNHPLG